MNLLTFGQYLIEEVDQQLLVERGAEQLLKAEVGKGVDLFFPRKHVAACDMLPPSAF